MHAALLLLLLVAVVVSGVAAQRRSPCPGVFAYEPMGKDQTDRWTGYITIESPLDLEGIWLQVTLDTPVHSLLNWFGEATTKNNREYSIRDLNYQVKANQQLKVKFQVIYNDAGKIPSVTRIRQNGVTICDGPQSPTAPETSTTKATIDVPGVMKNSGGGSDFFTENLQCGTRNLKAISLVVNGQPTEEGEWPWHVAIFKREAQLGYTCGGSLVGSNHIITAAHCVTKPKTKILHPNDIFTIRLGTMFLRKENKNLQQRKISKITIHPKYDPMYYHNDLAVLKLNEPIEQTDFVRPICLWDQGQGETVIGRLGSVVGWGYTANHTITDVLQEVKMPVVDTLTCIYSNRNFFSKVTSPTTFCAGFRNGTSVCNGDSGGGMFFSKETSTGDNVWQLRGLVSISLVLQKRYCDPFNYIVFTDLAQYYDWIIEQLV